MPNSKGRLCSGLTYFMALTACAVITMGFGYRRFDIGTTLMKVEDNGIEKWQSIKNAQDSTEMGKFFFLESFKSIFIFSAIVSDNCTHLSHGTVVNDNYRPIHACNKTPIINVIGWEQKDYQKQSVKCCYLLDTDDVTEYHNPNRHYYMNHNTVLLLSVHYECRFERSRNVTLRGVHMQVGKSSCESVRERYVLPMQQEIPTNSGNIAICLKFLFGNVDALWLVEWLEYYKEMKVDTVFVRLHKEVNVNVSRVVQFYVTEGFVKMLPYDIPLTREHVRMPSQKSHQVWNDEQVIVADFAVRYREYTYTMIIDLDEFLVPAKGNIKDLMSRLLKINPKAAGFTFKSTLLIQNRGKSTMYGSSLVSQFTMGTSAILNRKKCIVVSNRTKIGRRYTHGFRPFEGFQNVSVPSDVALVYHYRRYCYGNTGSICGGTRRDRTTILQVIRKTEPFSLAVKKKLKLIYV